MSIEEKIILMFEHMKDYDAQLELLGRLKVIAHRNYEKDKIERGMEIQKSMMGKVLPFGNMRKGRLSV